jgi:hypothetical protein
MSEHGVSMLFIVSKSGSTPDLLEIQEGVHNMVEELDMFKIVVEEGFKLPQFMTEIDEMLNEGLLSLEEVEQDIRLEEWLKSRCPICGYGDVIRGCCNYCESEFESNQEKMQESNHVSVDDYDEIMKRHNIDWKAYAEKQKKLKKVYGLKPAKRSSRRIDKPMNLGLQEHLLRKKLKKEFGDGADHYDPKTMINSDFHYDEQLEELGFDSGKRDEEEEAYYDEISLDYQCKVTGKDRETILAENKAKVEADLYKSILTLANINTFNEFQNAGNVRATRVTSIFKKPTIVALLKIMCNKFASVEYTHYLIWRYGLYAFKRDLSACSISALRMWNEDVQNGFTDPRTEKKNVFSIKERVLRGKPKEDFWLYYCAQQKVEINELCKELDIFDSDLAYICIIYAVDSFFNCSKEFRELTNALEHGHYYANGELLYDVQNCIVDHQNSYINNFLDILPVIKNECGYKALMLKLMQDEKVDRRYKALMPPSINADNIKYKEDTIHKIESFLRDLKS